MRRIEFNYPLPEELIAQYPPERRGDSRLLCLDAVTGELEDRQISDLTNLLNAGDLLVFNNTRVIPARLFGHKNTGGKVEILVERLTGINQMLAHLRCSKSPKAGSIIHIEDRCSFEVVDRINDFFVMQLKGPGTITDVLETDGHVPLPPYIQREDKNIDKERYQTVFASKPGAVAAPTAGLHFTKEILDVFSEKKVRLEFVTLHIGSGTFQPVRSDNIDDHQMHQEYLEVSEEVCNAVIETRKSGGRIVAVGTTSVRSLETAALSGTLNPFAGETDIFITPGFTFNVVDALITNFHLPESTLLMLVCAFAGHNNVMNAYRHAIHEKYRFYSYGDAMYIYR